MDIYYCINGASWRHGADVTFVLLPNGSLYAVRIYEFKGEDVPAYVLGIFDHILLRNHVLVFFPNGTTCLN